MKIVVDISTKAFYINKCNQHHQLVTPTLDSPIGSTIILLWNQRLVFNFITWMEQRLQKWLQASGLFITCAQKKLRPYLGAGFTMVVLRTDDDSDSDTMISGLYGIEYFISNQ